MNKFITFMRESSVARFFIPVGLILIIFGVIMFIINTKNQDYIKITATVSNVELVEESYIDTDGNQVEAVYNITVKYLVNDKEYSSTLDHVSKYAIGDEITIYYNPKDPGQITQVIVLPILCSSVLLVQ